MNKNNNNNSVNCWNCRHFNTSWDKNFRYRCAALNFKSSNLPCIEVRNADGRDCLAFQAKIINSI
jgi:hypothetical protein|tara:strand:- start:10797 stop:10991 length:195 start_codon:yes stop_codon:yes gene_type:complete